MNLSYLAALMLAWAYILSARWTEVMPGHCSLAYTGSRAAADDKCGSAFVVGIGDADLEEARWWAAVLAPGEGWQASMLVEEDRFLSPWSTSLRMPHCFLLSRTSAASSRLASSPCTAASPSDARRYLYKFCARHSILDQAHAALLAVVLLPWNYPDPDLQGRQLSTAGTASAYRLGCSLPSSPL